MKVCPICKKNNIYQTKKGWKCLICVDDIEPKEINSDKKKSDAK